MLHGKQALLSQQGSVPKEACVRMPGAHFCCPPAAGLPVTPVPEALGLSAPRSPAAQAETTPAAVCRGPVPPLCPDCLPLGRRAQREGKGAAAAGDAHPESGSSQDRCSEPGFGHTPRALGQAEPLLMLQPHCSRRSAGTSVCQQRCSSGHGFPPPAAQAAGFGSGLATCLGSCSRLEVPGQDVSVINC